MSRLLLDTQTFLWWLAADASLSRRARHALDAADNEKWLSVASVWELAIKISLRRLALDDELSELVRAATEGGVSILDVAPRHAFAVAAMPFHHRDPFDRVLIAQARAEDLVVVGANPRFDAYGVRRLW